MRFIIWISLAIATINLFTQRLYAQTQDTIEAQLQLSPPKPESLYAKYRDVANKDIVTIMSGNLDGGSINTAYDIATVLERTSDIRVIPIVGNGSAQNIKDILYLNGIDFAIVQPHVLWYLKKTGEVGPNIGKRIAYIATLFTDELHVIARNDVKDFKDLKGKRVNFSVKGSGTRVSMRLVLDALKMNVQEFNMRQADAFELMKAGQLDATVCTCSKPLHHIHMLKNKSKDFKVLSIPYTKELEEFFFPGLLSHEDYPDLIPYGQSIHTLAVQTIIGVHNWETKKTQRYQRLVRFVDAFFSNIKEFHQPPHQPKWWSVNIAASVKGLRRFEPAQAWLDRNAVSTNAKIDAVTPAGTNGRTNQHVKRGSTGKAISQPLQAVPSQQLSQ